MLIDSDFPQLPRIPLRPEKEPDVEIEIWKPGWNCFCCHDSGIVVPHLARKVIPDYDESKDKFPRCKKPGCTNGSQYDSDILRPSTDDRIEPLLCKKLDLLERETWHQTMFVYGKRVQKNAENLAKEKSLRVRDRTSAEHQAVQELHRLVCEED